ncbi:DUF6400 family protein [Streptosporangium sandarakinum]|uniref:Uncharacterized protein n=1 Tax=Streptosporangium sandarakinum TaxID=1260955 RepID=A0A852UWM9_9ACTN|nr:DUF6400 family protein [Streptosporangium sandarakinum]NYF38035.1 hypothetical protein [Streptosporangium sandarakinum]
MSNDSTGTPAEFVVDFDLSSHETRRRAAVVTALGVAWDPPAVMRAEQEAHDLLYSGLDPQQQEIYDMLVAAGVLPGGEAGRAAH